MIRVDERHPAMISIRLPILSRAVMGSQAARSDRIHAVDPSQRPDKSGHYKLTHYSLRASLSQLSLFG